jgi:hypothetical protein
MSNVRGLDTDNNDNSKCVFLLIHFQEHISIISNAPNLNLISKHNDHNNTIIITDNNN